MSSDPSDIKATLTRLKVSIENVASLIIREIKPEISQDPGRINEVMDRQQLLSLGIDMSELIRIVHFIHLDKIPASHYPSLHRDLLECEGWADSLLKHGIIDGREGRVYWTCYAGGQELKLVIERHSVKLWPYMLWYNLKAGGHPTLGRFRPDYSGPMDTMPPEPIPPREVGESPWFDYGGCRYLRPQPSTPPHTRVGVATSGFAQASDMEWESTGMRSYAYQQPSSGTGR
ncbi:hypothetical protein QBC34DRAFT_412681 [Podospora aff. communis PSN243]|uniref:Uncharacterized protein n=1 Tax=Podospora aff. communis PSN243 TaxID=3040156 RepID=A0AAV9GEM2_9PEZI|nr:hypothetical protein QBC34DRAFT_412681 [Podospora aff. communis PSN243]